MKKISESTFLRADSTELPAIRFSVAYGSIAYNAFILNGIGYVCFFDTGKYSYFKGTPEEIENVYWTVAKEAERFYA